MEYAPIISFVSDIMFISVIIVGVMNWIRGYRLIKLSELEKLRQVEKQVPPVAQMLRGKAIAGNFAESNENT